jgi:hypothetical protein
MEKRQPHQINRKFMTEQTTMQKLKVIAIFITALFSNTLFAAHALPEFDAIYAIQKLGIKLAETSYKLHYTESGYVFSQDTTLHGVASIFASDTASATSFVDEVGDNLLLTKHIYRQTGREKNRDEDIDIQWQTYKNTLKGKITGIVRSKEINLKSDTEIWDVLSFQIPLMIEANEDVKEYPYKAILKGEIDTYNFILTSTKKVRFAGKEHQALHLVRTDPNKNRQLHVWLVPALHNIPIVIENYRDGKEHSRAQLESVKFNNDEPINDQVTDDNDDF